MGKSYTDQLDEWVKQRQSAKREKNAVAFLVVLDDVKAAIDAGYAVKTIWRNLRETNRIDISYETFLLLVNRKIRNAQVTPQIRPVATTLASRSASSGFAFNPVANAVELL